jgi:hypothetical protein
VKKAISVTLTSENLLWLKAQAAARTSGNVSEVVDRLIRDARAAGTTDRSAIRSVVGSINLPDDETLAEAESSVRTMFDKSLARPILARRHSRRG